MSRAFVKETDSETIELLPDRPVSAHPNFVTPQGWKRSRHVFEHRPARHE